MATNSNYVILKLGFTDAEFEAKLVQHLEKSGFTDYGKQCYESDMRFHWEARNTSIHSYRCIVHMMSKAVRGDSSQSNYCRSWEETLPIFVTDLRSASTHSKSVTTTASEGFTDLQFDTKLQQHLNNSGFSNYGKKLYERNMRNHWQRDRSSDIIKNMMSLDIAPRSGTHGSGLINELWERRNWEEIEPLFEPTVWTIIRGLDAAYCPRNGIITTEYVKNVVELLKVAEAIPNSWNYRPAELWNIQDREQNIVDAI